MKRLNQIVVTTFVLGFGLAAFAQGPSRTRNYDPKTEVKMKGTVADVQQHPGKRGGTGTHLILKTESGSLPVHVGPSSYIAKKQFSFSKGDQIEVLGSKVSLAGTETLIAREITKEGKTLVLRNAQGIPEWGANR